MSYIPINLNRYTICLSVSVAIISSNFAPQLKSQKISNLSPGEIISQIILSKIILTIGRHRKITNQVLMGEGSPF